MNFNPSVLIAKKRDGGTLSAEEIQYFIRGFTDGSIHDYQMSALAMAIFICGMTVDETAALTETMLRSGTTLEWNAGAPCVDKHSTGGIGDKTSLILAPLLAVCGARVPMISGRGLGATGGTLDKLEAIPGFRTNLELPEIQTVVERVGCVITGASAELAPADRKLYALRDVTGTVPSIPLITASIMSKKLAEGLDALVLDVKFGSGAFMKSLQQAQALAASLVNTGRRMGVKTTALLTDMNQPLGRMAGNANEVLESIDVLKGAGPEDVRELTLDLCAEVLVSTGIATSLAAARERLQRALEDGSAFERYEQMVVAQGGDPRAKLELAPEVMVLAPIAGYVSTINTEALGIAVIEMGGGRRKLGDQLDFGVGFEMLVRIGDQIEKGQPLVKLFVRNKDAERAAAMMLAAIKTTDEPISTLPLVVARL